MARPARALLFLSIAALVAGCATTQRTDLGSGAHALTKRAGFVVVRSSVLKEQVEREALAECASRKLALSVLDITAADPEPPAYAVATIQYRCVAP